MIAELLKEPREPFLTIKQAAKLLRIDPRKLAMAVQAGLVRGYNQGNYVRLSEILDDQVIGAIDVDDDRLVRSACVIFGDPPSAKFGKKGITIFVRVPKGQMLKSTQLRDASGTGKVDVLLPGKMTVLPPTLHPD